MTTTCPLCGDRIGALPNHLRRDCAAAKATRDRLTTDSESGTASDS